jgi:cytoskeletal protein RodZ
VTVGETLTEARYQAGLSVDELSERTRIRGTVIRSIEQDDYGACGGDLYVRGYVRAIAGAVGIDAQPLIREYDLGRANSQSDRANGSAGSPAGGLPSAPPPAAAPTAFDLPAVTEAPAGDGGPADLAATRFDLPAVRADPAATSYDLPAVPEFPAATAEFPAATADFPAALPFAMIPPDLAPAAAAQPPQPPGVTETRLDLAAAPEDLMAAGYDLRPAAPAEADAATSILPALGTDQAGPREPAGPPVPVADGTTQASFVLAGPVRASTRQAGRARRKRRGLFALAAVVVLAAAGGLGIYLGTGSTATTNTAATTVPGPAASAAAKASAAAQASAAARASASASAAAQASASAAAKSSQEAAAKAEAGRVVSLPVASATAFGPDGFADGDNPGNAKYAIARDAAQPWESQWYATPDFGMLKHGTGLLLDLGGKVTVTSVRLDLGQYGSTDLQIRVGNGTAPQDLKVAATASNVGGLVKLTLRHPAAARYVLLWFTQLPPDGAGHYQESVSNVVVSGHR